MNYKNMLTNLVMESHINQVIDLYDPIKLEEMDAVKLMNRTDTKYILNANLIYEILHKAQRYYSVLDIDKSRQFQYVTTYYDTNNFNMYREHLNGKLNRYKIRQRRYDITGKEFFEIKFKNNKGKTLKSRIVNEQDTVLNDLTNSFLQRKTPYAACQLRETLQNTFIRITLVDNNKSERATLDYNLSFSANNNLKYLPQLGIVEIKQDSQSGNSPLIDILKNMSIREGGISKYCLGVASLYNNLKINRLKPQLLKIQNL